MFSLNVIRVSMKLVKYFRAFRDIKKSAQRRKYRTHSLEPFSSFVGLFLSCLVKQGAFQIQEGLSCFVCANCNRHQRKGKNISDLALASGISAEKKKTFFCMSRNLNARKIEMKKCCRVAYRK